MTDATCTSRKCARGLPPPAQGKSWLWGRRPRRTPTPFAQATYQTLRNKTMKLHQTATLLALCTALATPGWAQDDFARLKAFDYQDRTAATAIRAQIQLSSGDATRRAQIESGLVGVLDDPGATLGGKLEACRLLLPVTTARATPALARLLLDPALSDAARYALERSPDRAAGVALLNALGKTTGRVRVGIINSLGDRAEAEAVPALKPLATDSDPLTAEAATAALGKIGTPAAVRVLTGLNPSPLVSQSLIVAAGRRGAEGDTKGAERVYATQTGETTPPAQRIAVLRGLVGLQSAQAPRAVVAALHSTDGSVQAAAASLVPVLPDATVQAITLFPALPPSAQTVLLAGWRVRGTKQAAPLAESVLQSPDAILRAAAIRAVAALDGPKGVPMLTKIAATGTGDDRAIARECLTNLPGADADNVLMAGLVLGTEAERIALLGIFADRGTASARTILLGAARNSNPHLAVAAARGLGRAGGGLSEYNALVGILATTSDDTLRDTAQTAVAALAKQLSTNDAAAPLLAALPTAPRANRAALITSLADVGGDRALQAIYAALASPDADVKDAALTALAESWGDARPASALLNIARTDTSNTHKVQALRGYLRLVGLDEATPAPARAAQVAGAYALASRPEERRLALSVLRDLRTPDSLALAARALDDPAVFEEAADAVVYLAAPQRKGRVTLPAVKGPATVAALDKVIAQTADPKVKAAAQKAR